MNADSLFPKLLEEYLRLTTDNTEPHVLALRQWAQDELAFCNAELEQQDGCGR